MNTKHQKEVCEKVLAVIKSRWGIEISCISYPDEENRNEEAVDMQVEHSKGTIVLEHTRIESYTNQIAESKWAKELFEPIKIALKGKLPIHSKFELCVDSNDLSGARNKKDIQKILTEWIVRTAPTLQLPSEAPLHMVRTMLSGVPFEITLCRWEGDKGKFSYPLFAPDELENERLKRIKKALDEKCPKLMKARNQDGNSILLLESNDICLANHSSISKALNSVLKECKNVPDTILLIKTEIKPWNLWILKEGQIFFSEIREPKRYEIV
jgi:hypothetical protein